MVVNSGKTGGGHAIHYPRNNHDLSVRVRVVPGLSRNQAGHVPGSLRKMKRSRLKEPSSWGSLGAMVIGIALMPPANDLLMALGIAFCALGIALRERHE